MKTYAINICLIPDKKTYKICEELNKFDNWDYNKNTLKYIPHATLVMKSIDELDFKLLKEKLAKLSIGKIFCKTLDYYCKNSPVWLWNGIYIRKSKEIKNLQKQIINITKGIENKELKKESYIVQDFYSENWVELNKEKYFENNDKIHITFWKKDIKKEFEKSNFPKEVVFEKLVIWQMWNYWSVRKILFEIKL